MVYDPSAKSRSASGVFPRGFPFTSTSASAGADRISRLAGLRCAHGARRRTRRRRARAALRRATGASGALGCAVRRVRGRCGRCARDIDGRLVDSRVGPRGSSAVGDRRKNPTANAARTAKARNIATIGQRRLAARLDIVCSARGGCADVDCGDVGSSTSDVLRRSRRIDSDGAAIRLDARVARVDSGAIGARSRCSRCDRCDGCDRRVGRCCAAAPVASVAPVHSARTGCTLQRSREIARARRAASRDRRRARTSKAPRSSTPCCCLELRAGCPAMPRFPVDGLERDRAERVDIRRPHPATEYCGRVGSFAPIFVKRGGDAEAGDARGVGRRARCRADAASRGGRRASAA